MIRLHGSFATLFPSKRYTKIDIAKCCTRYCIMLYKVLNQVVKCIMLYKVQSIQTEVYKRT